MCNLKIVNSKLAVLFYLASVHFLGCATPNKNIAIGGVIGGVAGAVAGRELTRTESHKDRNTVVTALAVGLATAGALAWHYREMEKQLVEVSGRYSRYRLCEATDISGQIAPYNEAPSCREEVYQIPLSQLGETAISLDEDTKWLYPTFRKRQLAPELGADHVISRRYIWEIIQPGRFITREQKPDLFAPKRND